MASKLKENKHDNADRFRSIMVVVKENFPQLTPEEYLDWEEKQLEKHEYIDGQIYAMGGGTVNHGRIAIRFTAMFDTHVGDRGCITGNSDIKVNTLSISRIILILMPALPALNATGVLINTLPIFA